MSTTREVTVSEARADLGAIVQRALAEPVYLTKYGRRMVAIIGADELDRLIELAGDLADIRAAEEARTEMAATSAEPIPWEQVKADLGLV